MKLVKEIKTGSQTWGIYELSERQKEKYKGNYILSRGVFSDFILEIEEEDSLIDKLSKVYYEGIFQTELEAVQQTEIAELESKLKNINLKLRDIIDDCFE